MHQFTQESKSLWRIKNNYITEALTDEEKSFWTKLAQEKEDHVAELKDLIKNNIITYLHEKGQSDKIYTGKVNENVSYGDLFEIKYYFISKNKGYKYEKRVSLYKGNNKLEKQKELDELEYTITEIGNSDYDSIYEFYSRNVKGK